MGENVKERPFTGSGRARANMASCNGPRTRARGFGAQDMENLVLFAGHEPDNPVTEQCLCTAACSGRHLLSRRKQPLFANENAKQVIHTELKMKTRRKCDRHRRSRGGLFEAGEQVRSLEETHCRKLVGWSTILGAEPPKLQYNNTKKASC